MRCLYLSLLLLLSPSLAAQEPITEAQLQKLQQQLADLIPDKRSGIKKNYKLEAKDAVPIYFYLESWRIDTLLSMRINLDFSTQGMNQTVRSAAEAYVALQKDLIREIVRLDSTFELLLEEGEASWNSSLAREIDLFEEMQAKYGDKLGSIYSHNASSHYLEKAKARAGLLFQLYEDLRWATKGSLPSTQRD